MTTTFARIDDAIAAVRDGRMIVVCDEEDRENEGDLTIAAEKITPEAINFMARHGRGLICLPMTPERLDQLEIPLMVAQNSTTFEPAFCVSIEAKAKTTTGISVADLIKYRLRTESVVTCVASADLPTQYGPFRIHAFENAIDDRTHIALVRGELGDGEAVLVRVHTQCLTGDVLHSIRCDCGAQLDAAIWRISEEGRGVVLYLNQDGHDVGLADTIRAYGLQDQGFDSADAEERLGLKADQRDYGMGVQVLRSLGVRSMRLLSNNPRQLVGIEGYGLSVTEWLPLEIRAFSRTSSARSLRR